MIDAQRVQVQEANQDYETRRAREDVMLNLTENQYISLKLLSYRAGFETAGDFLTSLVGDLTGWHSNGSDERDFAEGWYERAFGMADYYSYFRHHLFNFDYTIDDMAVMLEDEEFFEVVYLEYLAENPRKKNESREECLSLLKNLVEKGKEL